MQFANGLKLAPQNYSHAHVCGDMEIRTMNRNIVNPRLKRWLQAKMSAVTMIVGGMVVALLGAPLAAHAGAGWGDSSNPAPVAGISAIDFAGATKVRTYYANSPMGMQLDVLTGSLTRDTGPAMRKFIDGLPGLGALNPSVGALGNLTDGTYIPVAVPDQTTYVGADYYEIAVVEYTQRMHSDLPKATQLRGYVQIDPKATDDAATAAGVTGLLGGGLSPTGSKKLALTNPDGSIITISRPKTDGSFQQVQAYAVDKPSYMGPMIIAAHGTPTRVKFYNALPAGRGYTTGGVFARQGDLFLPVDHTLNGGGEGPTMTGYRDILCGDAVTGPNTANNPATSSCLGGKNSDGTSTPAGYVHVPNYAIFTENRSELHLHGGDNPWISDGTPHQWIVPAADELNTSVTQDYRRGVGAINVPDMPNPGPGAMTYFYPNGQSGRLMFYHDHTTGLTRLNVYAGEAAGYLMTDPSERAISAFAVQEIPLVIQEKTFVPQDIAVEDAKWDTTHWGQPGDLWFAHVYETNQDPASADGTNPVGRWDGASFFWPVFPQAYATPSGAYGDVTTTPEAFNDTPIINGMAYPTLTVQPSVYRFRMLNAANDRFLSLSLYVADSSVASTSGIPNTEVRMVPFSSPNGPTATTYSCPDGVSVGQTVGTVNKYGTITKAGWTESGLNNVGQSPYTTSFPCAGGVMGTGWGSADGRPGGVPDPTLAGPDIVQIGNETGLIPAPIVIPATPINYEYNKRSVTVLNVLERGLWLSPAGRSDVLIDFSQFAGKTLILYNDSSAPVPAGDPRIDYYTGIGDQTGAGGAPDTLPGYGPNTRTIMQIQVAGTTNGTAFDPATTVVNGATLPTTLMAGYIATKDAPVVATSEYQPVADALTAAAKPSFTATAPYSHVYTGAIYQNTFVPMTVNVIEPFKYTPAPVCALSADCLALLTAQRQGTGGGLVKATAGQTIKAYVEPKAISELFDLDYGRMNATLGVELPFTNVNIQTTIPVGYIDPVTETIQPGEMQFWKIVHNGVDSHPVHFHLLNVQVINRAGWDGTIKAPMPDEIGWKETVVMHPLEDIIVAVRAKTIPPAPFGLPHSFRRPSPNQTAADSHGITQIDVNTGLAPAVPYTNDEQDYGYEYTWHCHILGHEENDFMRPFVFRVTESLPGSPSNVSSTLVTAGIQIGWSDPSPVPNPLTSYDPLTGVGFLGNPANEIGFRIERAPVNGGTVGAYTAVNANYSLHTLNAHTGALNAAANSTSYTDSTVAGLGATSVTTPALPTIAAGANGTSAVLTFPALPGGAASFSVYRADITTNAAAASNVIASNITTATYTDAAVVAGHTYAYELTANAPNAGAAPVFSYRVVAVNAAGESVSSPVQITGVNVSSSALTAAVNFVAVPSTPTTAPRISAVTTTGMTVTWTASPAIETVTGYRLQRATNSGFTTGVTTTTTLASVTNVVVTGLTANTTYYYRVQAINASGTGGYGPAVNGPTLAVAPTALTVKAKTVNSVSLSWTQATPTTGLTYVVKGAAGAALPRGATVAYSGTSAVVSGLASNTSYTFSVVAVNASGQSAPSANSAAALTLAAAVSGVTVGTVTTTSVLLSWTAPTVTTGLTYTVTGGGSVAITGTSATITGLTANTTYTFSVAATNGTGASTAVASAPVTTLAVAPTALTVTATTANSVSLSWTQATPTTGLTYLVKGAAGAALPTGATVAYTGTTAVVSGLASNTSYTFSVVAVNASARQSAASANSAAALTLPAAVTGLTVGTVLNTSVVLSWTAPTVATGLTYTVTGGGSAAITGTSATITGLTATTAYTFSVVAKNTAGSSAAVSVAVTTIGAPAVPAAPTATAVAASTSAPSISLAFAAPASGTTYTVYRSFRTSVAGAYNAATSVATGVTGTSWTDTALTTGNGYRYYLVAVNAVGSSANGAYSATVTASGQLPNAPTTLAGTAVAGATVGTGTRSVNLTWALGAANGAPITSMNVQYVTGATWTGTVLAGPTAAASAVAATVTGLTLNTTYTFRVNATNAYGATSSTTVTVKTAN